MIMWQYLKNLFEENIWVFKTILVNTYIIPFQSPLFTPKSTLQNVPAMTSDDTL